MSFGYRVYSVWSLSFDVVGKCRTDPDSTSGEYGNIGSTDEAAGLVSITHQKLSALGSVVKIIVVNISRKLHLLFESHGQFHPAFGFFCNYFGIRRHSIIRLASGNLAL